MGSTVSVGVASICVPGDTDTSVDNAPAVGNSLREARVEMRPFIAEAR